MLGKKEKCKKCGEKIDKEWQYCPFCGNYLREEIIEEPFFSYFGKTFEEIKKEFDKMFEFKLPKIDVDFPSFSGIRVTITSKSGEKPKIDVKTYGNYKKYEPEIKKRLGIKIPVEEVESEEKEAKITEEVPFQIRREGRKKIIEMNLPGVKELKDVKIKKLSQSIEVRAYSKDKAYFNLIPIEDGEEIVNTELKNEKLTIYLE
ncbi:MAG: zinc-ribbon domain-containing protein [Candidatus Aenigmarchaeota archaeon]|nr:zinc-ribbon domain-containing protein [Candidatus Aenigmarchaeota archaeon]MDW8149635.1 zinc-ribbon domain-containing protein [Candidatus Aenigmarchaeota archaeon]